jgi:hypothetical protein
VWVVASTLSLQGIIHRTSLLTSDIRVQLSLDVHRGARRQPKRVNCTCYSMTTCSPVGTAAVAGAEPYQLKRNARYDGDVIDALPQPNAAACATTCSLWQTRGVSCSAWVWSPKEGLAGGDCTLLSRISPLTHKAQGSVAGSLGESPAAGRSSAPCRAPAAVC